MEKDVVSSYSEGLLELVRLYEQHYKNPVEIIPTSLKYKVPRRLPKMAPAPIFHLPFPGKSVTINFGEGRHLGDRDPTELMETILRETSNRSNLEYLVENYPT